MRDTLNNLSIYENLIQKENKDISHYKEVIEKAIQLNGPDSKGVKNGYIIINTSYQRIINTMYSAGYAIEAIRIVFKDLLANYSNIWNREFGYIELVKVVSLAVLLNIDADEIKPLEDRLVSEKFDDCLINFLIKAIDPSWCYNSKSFEYPVYECLLEIIDDANASYRINEYLVDKWYKLHKECAWYDSHKNNKNLYTGYWSFEAGAVAKILGIDDSSLKDVKYYPYDLVHFEG